MKLKHPLNETTEWLYDAASRLTQRKLANGTSDNIGYDSRSRVSTIALKNSAQTLLRQHTYGYDLASNITSDNVAGVTTSYSYDEIDQLISESRPGYSCAYAYDKNGNRATRTLNGVAETYTCDAADKLTAISVGGQTTRTITYDSLGRRKTDTHDGATSTYNWDQESRITSITRPGMQTHTFDYNGLDTRVSKTLAGNTATTYKRAGASVTDPVMLETTGSVATNHTPGISEKRGTGASTYLHSGMKDADARTATAQTVDASRQYDAFGNVVSSTGTWAGPFGYAGGYGYQEDGESSLKLLGHRYYDSSTALFLSTDPISSGRNNYSYCGSSPVASQDGSGLQTKCLTVAGDTAGDAAWAWLLPHHWGSIEAPSRLDVMRKLCLEDYDMFNPWGHGAPGKAYVNGDEYTGSDDMRLIGRFLRANGKPKLKCILIEECFVLQDPDFVNACLEVADEVVGYQGWTVSPARQNQVGRLTRYREQTQRKIPFIEDDDDYWPLWLPFGPNSRLKQNVKGVKGRA